MKKHTMLRQIFSAAALLSLSLTGACQSAQTPEASAGWITGRVLDETGDPISARLSIGADTITTDADGAFALSPEYALVYPIEVAAEGHYPMRHTFSHAELQADPDLGDVTLVSRSETRTLFVFGGDAMIGRRFYTPFEGEPTLVRAETQLEDSKALLREMKPYLERADYASINLETPVFEAPPGPAAPKFVTFYSDPDTLEALQWAGVDYVALGNNHTYDFLEPGLDLTLSHLSESGLGYSGVGKNEVEAVKPHRTILAGETYDLSSFVGWPAGPPTQSAEVDKGGAALGAAANMVSASQQSVATGGVPILQFHGGLEYVEEPTMSVETRVKQAVDAGAALIVAHHPHVTQGLEVYDGKLIAWSLGNFLFDQYFYSAQSAALLYVWMDGDEFYHAEAVPVYIKGYVPTPALGPMREAINRRVFELSSRRETELHKSGGHLMLSSQSGRIATAPEFAIELDCEGERGRVGHDLLARGDFDSFDLFGAPDRSWLMADGQIVIEPAAEDPTDFVMRVAMTSGETVTAGMRKFMRVFPRAAPMSIRAELTASSDTNANIFLQIRAEGQGLSDALSDGRKIKLGQVDLAARETLALDLDFDSPRVRARSIRLLMEFSPDESDASVTIDDLKLIAWDTPFEQGSEFCR